MSSVLKQAMQQIVRGFRNGEKRYLVNGKSCSGKTKISNKILSYFIKNGEFNPFIINGDNFGRFFSLSSLNDYKTIKIPIENTKISLDFTTDNVWIQPHPLSDIYKDIFKEHKYIEKNKVFSHVNNLLIIDDCDKIDLIFIFVVDKALRLIFDSEQFFGGVNLLFIGNSKVATNFDNIFSSALYNNNKNIYKIFNLISINQVKTIFSKTNPELEQLSVNSLIIENTLQNSAGILKEKYKLYFKQRDVEINRTDLYFETYFSNDYKEINNFNEDVLENINSCKYIFKPYKLFDDNSIDKIKLDYFYKFYDKALNPLILFDNAKIVFTMDIPEEGIKKGQFGYVKKINIKKNISNLNNEFLNIDLQSHFKELEIEVNGVLKKVTTRKIRNPDTGLIFISLPIILGYCVHFKFLSYLEKGNVLLTKNINIHVVEACINKILDIGFKNTSLLNYDKLFKTTYSDTIKNGF